MNKLFAATLAALAVPALLSTSATAQEARTTEVTVRDGAGDVWTAPVGGDTFTAAPEQRVGDVLRMRVAHRHEAVTVRLVFADLRRAGSAFYELDLRTDKGAASAQVEAGRHHWAGRQHLWAADGNQLTCAGMTHRIDYDANVVTLRIPRSCLGDPTWVRALNYDRRETATTQYVDNPANHEALPGGFTRRLYRA